MEDLLASNHGLHRRFSKRLEFRDWSVRACVKLLKVSVTDEALTMSHEMMQNAGLRLGVLISRSGWGNAGDVITAHSDVSGLLTRGVMKIVICSMEGIFIVGLEGFI